MILFGVPYAGEKDDVRLAGVVLVEASTAIEAERQAGHRFTGSPWVRLGDAVEVDVSFGLADVRAVGR